MVSRDHNTACVCVLVAGSDGQADTDVAADLRRLGYAVAPVTASPEDAIAAVRATRPDLVLMALEPPGEIEAVNTGRRIRADFRVPVLYLTAHLDSTLLDHIMVSDPCGCLIAPADPMQIHAAINIALHRHRTEQGLRAGDAHFRAIFDRAGQGMALTDRTGRFIMVNPAWKEMLGYTTEEALQLSNLDITHPDDDRVVASFSGALFGGEITSYRTHERLVRKDGTMFWADVSVAALDPVAEDCGLALALVVDVSECKQAEEKLRRSTESYKNLYAESQRTAVLHRSLLDWSPDAIVIYDMEGRVKYFNGMFARMFGWTLEELRGKLVPYVPESEEAITSELISKVIKSGMLTGFDTRRFTKDGRILDVNVSGSRFPDHEGNPAGMLVIIRDITERKRSEAQVRAALAEKEVLLREIHHRVKNNFQVIHSLLGLQSRYTSDEAVRDLLRNARDRVRSMALIHERLYQSDNLAHLKVRDYVSSLVDELAVTYSDVASRITLTKQISHVSLSLDTAIPLGFIITELFSNCLKHAFPNGRTGGILVSLQSPAERQFELIVKDDGIGLPTEASLANPKSLGLRLVRVFSEQLGSSINVLRSQGTEFRITFHDPAR